MTPLRDRDLRSRDVDAGAAAADGDGDTRSGLERYYCCWPVLCDVNNRNRTVNAGQHPERPSFDLLSSRGEDGKMMLRMGGDRASFLDYLIISNPARSHGHKIVCSLLSQLNARALE